MFRAYHQMSKDKKSGEWKKCPTSVSPIKRAQAGAFCQILFWLTVCYFLPSRMLQRFSKESYGCSNNYDIDNRVSFCTGSCHLSIKQNVREICGVTMTINVTRELRSNILEQMFLSTWDDFDMVKLIDYCTVIRGRSEQYCCRCVVFIVFIVRRLSWVPAAHLLPPRHQVYRHGDRSPVHVYPNYQHEDYWVGGLGHLTTVRTSAVSCCSLLCNILAVANQ